MAENNNTIYDDVFRTIQERHPKLLIPLINEAFHIDYEEDEAITRLPEEYQKVVSKVIADGCSIIRNHVYHMECQSTKDGSMVLRMAEYDFMIGLSQAKIEDGTYRIRFPHSCIFYLRHSGSSPDEEELELLFADGQIVKYKVPVIKAQEYTKKELFEKKLYICLPYYIMRYEKEFHKISQDEEKVKKLTEEYEQILSELWKKTGQEESGLYQDLWRLVKKVADYQLRNEADLKKGWEK